MPRAAQAKAGDLQQAFKDAVAMVQDPKGGGAQPDNATKLKFYALFKQATEGDCAAAKPSRLNMVAYAKWEAWNKLKKTSKDDAMREYVKTLAALDGAAAKKFEGVLGGGAQLRSKL